MSINKGHPAFFAKIIQSQGCSPSMQTPLASLIWKLFTLLQCQFYAKNRTYVSYRLIKI